MTELLVIWAIINAFALFIIFVLFLEGANFSFVNPKVIYNSIKVNWFGAYFLAVVLNIIFPVISILYWLYKVCTIGRD
jgi:hypothetical protein